MHKTHLPGIISQGRCSCVFRAFADFAIQSHIKELRSLTATHALSDIEFDVIRQMLSSFKDTLDNMGVEQKRAALRAFVKRIIWDGKNINLFLFGSDDNGGVDLPINSEDNAEPLCENSKCYVLPCDAHHSFQTFS